MIRSRWSATWSSLHVCTHPMWQFAPGLASGLFRKPRTWINKETMEDESPTIPEGMDRSTIPLPRTCSKPRKEMPACTVLISWAMAPVILWKQSKYEVIYSKMVLYLEIWTAVTFRLPCSFLQNTMRWFFFCECGLHRIIKLWTALGARRFHETVFPRIRACWIR